MVAKISNSYMYVSVCIESNGQQWNDWKETDNRDLTEFENVQITWKMR